MWSASMPAPSSSSGCARAGQARGRRGAHGQVGVAGGASASGQRSRARPRDGGPRRRRCGPTWRRGAARVAASIGLTEYRSMTRARMPSLDQGVGRGQALMQSDPGADEGHVVVAEDAAAWSRRPGTPLGRVEHGVGAAGGAQVADPAGAAIARRARPCSVRRSGRAPSSPCTARIIARSSRRHLGRAVGADLDAGVRADQPEVDPRDRRPCG